MVGGEAVGDGRVWEGWSGGGVGPSLALLDQCSVCQVKATYAYLRLARSPVRPLGRALTPVRRRPFPAPSKLTLSLFLDLTQPDCCYTLSISPTAYTSSVHNYTHVTSRLSHSPRERLEFARLPLPCLQRRHRRAMPSRLVRQRESWKPCSPVKHAAKSRIK